MAKGSTKNTRLVLAGAFGINLQHPLWKSSGMAGHEAVPGFRSRVGLSKWSRQREAREE